MQKKIKIREVYYENDLSNFYFSTNDGRLTSPKLKCFYCGMLLSPEYSVLMIKLKKSNLINDDDVPTCCTCFNLITELKRTKRINLSNINDTTVLETTSGCTYAITKAVHKIIEMVVVDYDAEIIWND